MGVNWDDNKLTDEIILQLKQGSKVRFKWHGNSELIYNGRIEIDEYGKMYFIPEHCFEGDELIQEGMRYYNTLQSFCLFTMFEIIEL